MKFAGITTDAAGRPVRLYATATGETVCLSSRNGEGSEAQATPQAQPSLPLPWRSLFIGVYSTGLVYCDPSREIGGDYQVVAFLPYNTLALEVRDERSPLLPAIREHAATMTARRGERYGTSEAGQSVVLGGL